MAMSRTCNRKAPRDPNESRLALRRGAHADADRLGAGSSALASEGCAGMGQVAGGASGSIPTPVQRSLQCGVLTTSPVAAFATR
jgi:hypothetical protein